MVSRDKAHSRPDKKGNRQAVITLGWFITSIYFLILFWELFLGNYRVHQLFTRSANLIPFLTISHYILNRNYFSLNILVINLAGNICVFIPMGFLLPCLLKGLQRFWRIFLLGTVFILAVESLQWILRVGIFDVDDIILNVSGILIGYGIFKLVRFIIKG